MKKVFSLLIAFVVMATSLWFSVSIASAAGSAVVLHVPGVTQQQLKDATMLVNSEYQHVSCVLKDAETGKVVCRVPGKYAGEDVQIFLAGQAFSATVSAPRDGRGSENDEQDSEPSPAKRERLSARMSNSGMMTVRGHTHSQCSSRADRWKKWMASLNRGWIMIHIYTITRL